MKNAYFENVVTVGNLYLAYILYEFENEPILFICSDDSKELYLCICAEIRGHMRWIVACCQDKILSDLVSQKIPIASAFLLNDKVIAIEYNNEDDETSKVINSKEINLLDLPEEGLMLRVSEEDKSSIAQLSLQRSNHENS